MLMLIEIPDRPAVVAKVRTLPDAARLAAALALAGIRTAVRLSDRSWLPLDAPPRPRPA